MEDIIETGRREVCNGRPQRHEPLEIRADSRHRRLLQHDLAQPYMIGIGTNAGRRAPRHGPSVSVVPVKQRFRETGTLGMVLIRSPLTVGSGLSLIHLSVSSVVAALREAYHTGDGQTAGSQNQHRGFRPP